MSCKEHLSPLSLNRDNFQTFGENRMIAALPDDVKPILFLILYELTSFYGHSLHLRIEVQKNRFLVE
jgi:hypothetical protein